MTRVDDDIKVVQREIETLTKRLGELEELRSKRASYSREQLSAIALHDKFCRYDHTDGCGWYYEANKFGEDWNGHAHSTWLKKAQFFCTACDKSNVDYEVVLKIMESV